MLLVENLDFSLENLPVREELPQIGMSELCKSPLHVAQEALAVARQCLRRYTHKFSPKKFTQHQLFTCLVLKTFLKTDYRGLTAHLTDHSDLRTLLELRTVPHYTTFQKASRRLLCMPKGRLVNPCHHSSLPQPPLLRRTGCSGLDRPGLWSCQPILHPAPKWQRKVLADSGLQPICQAGGGIRLQQPFDVGRVSRSRASC